MSYRIVYFAFVGDKFEGVEQKIIAQFDALTALGAHINLYFISRYTPGKTLFTEVAKRRNVEILVNTSQNTRNPLSRRKEKFKLISKVLSHFNPGDTIIYLRYPLADFLFLKFLKRNKAFKFVTEHQDIEYSSIKGWQRIMEIIWGRPVRRRITGFVGVTSEITEFERSCTHGKDHYFATIGNGIDIRKYPLRIPIHENSNSEIRMLFVGGGQLHHGLDRLIESMHLYFKNGNNGIDFRLKIAGSSDVMQKNVKLAEKFELLPKINFLGNIDNENLNDLFN